MLSVLKKTVNDGGCVAHNVRSNTIVADSIINSGTDSNNKADLSCISIDEDVRNVLKHIVHS